MSKLHEAIETLRQNMGGYDENPAAWEVIRAYDAELAEPRMSSTPNCHDDGHRWDVLAHVRDDGTMVDVCVSCGQTRAQVDAYEAQKRQEASC